MPLSCGGSALSREAQDFQVEPDERHQQPGRRHTTYVFRRAHLRALLSIKSKSITRFSAAMMTTKMLKPIPIGPLW